MLEEEREFKIRIGPPRMTKYERARIIGARALQISLGAPVLIPLDKDTPRDPVEIAMRELELGILPIIIRRRAPSGEYQDIPLRFLVKASRTSRS